VVEQCPFKAWVAGSNPAALTKILKHLADFGRVDFGHPRTPRAHVDTELAAKDLLNNRMAYLGVSRGKFDAQIFTNDRGVLWLDCEGVQWSTRELVHAVVEPRRMLPLSTNSLARTSVLTSWCSLQRILNVET
jgi:hypothetical protein